MDNHENYATTITSKIYSPLRKQQIMDFHNFTIDETGDLYPTDIDGIIEFKNAQYVLFEIKHKGAAVPTGQRLALQRMVDDFTAIGKEAIVFVGEHDVEDTSQSVDVANCRVREMYYGKEKKWRTPDVDIAVREATLQFLDKTRARAFTVKAARRSLTHSLFVVDNRCLLTDGTEREIQVQVEASSFVKACSKATAWLLGRENNLDIQRVVHQQLWGMSDYVG